VCHAMKKNVEIYFTRRKLFLVTAVSFVILRYTIVKILKRISRDTSLVNQLVKRSKEMSVVALKQSGQINYGAGFDRLISSPKWLLLPHPARQYQPANPAHSDEISTSRFRMHMSLFSHWYLRNIVGSSCVLIFLCIWLHSCRILTLT